MNVAQAIGTQANTELVKMTCQFGILDTRADYLAEFSHSGTIVVEKHPFLPPTFWEYAVIDESERVVFTSNFNTSTLGLDKAVSDYYGDGNEARIDCLFTSHSNEIPAGTILSCKRDLHDPHDREMVFSRTIKGVNMSWRRVACQDKTKEYYSVSFGNRSHDAVHLRALTGSEKEFLRTHKDFGLFLSSQFYYPSGEKSWLLETTIGYRTDSPWSLDPHKFYFNKVRDISFGQAPWRGFDGYRHPGDVFVSCRLLDYRLPEREYSTDPIHQKLVEISSGSPNNLSWGIFESLFSFKRMGDSMYLLYGEYGALRSVDEKIVGKI